MNLESFDTIAYLESLGIEYRESGKNISKNYIGVCCPFCDDNSFHLGIHKQSKTISCWKCGVRSNVLKLIQEVSLVSYNQAIAIFYKFQDSSLAYLNPKEEVRPQSSVDLPKGSSKNFTGVFTNYLFKRNFQPDTIIKTYDLYAGAIGTDFAYRIIIPIYQQYELVAYLGRDATEKNTLKYLNCPVELSKIPIKECLYNLDAVRDKAIIVEGVTDVWRLGAGAIATFGVQYTRQQLSLLIGLKKVFVLYDQDAAAQS